ncbi:unnamed protein product [Leuciscus chuanchicus]
MCLSWIGERPPLQKKINAYFIIATLAPPTGGVSITGETECETESSGRRGNKRIRGVPGFHAGLKKPGLQKREGPGPIFPPPPPPPPPTEGQI